MKRDLEVFRSILLKCEEAGQEWFELFIQWPETIPDNFQSDWTESERFHLNLMEDAGLIERRNMFDVDHLRFDYGVEFRLTNAGHEFLDAVRDEKIWRRTKEVAAKAGTFTLDSLLEVARSVATGVLTATLKSTLGI